MKGPKSRNSKLTIGNSASANNRFNYALAQNVKSPKYIFPQAQNFANLTYEALPQRGVNGQLNMMNATFNSSQFNGNMMSLAQLKSEERVTKEGNIIGSIYWTKNFVMEDDRRYINPRMEEELRLFKEKIAVRLKNGQIPKTYKFPRLSDPDIHP